MAKRQVATAAVTAAAYEQEVAATLREIERLAGAVRVRFMGHSQAPDAAQLAAELRGLRVAIGDLLGGPGLEP